MAMFCAGVLLCPLTRQRLGGPPDRCLRPGVSFPRNSIDPTGSQLRSVTTRLQPGTVGPRGRCW